jgi:uncharacterized protein
MIGDQDPVISRDSEAGVAQVTPHKRIAALVLPGINDSGPAHWQTLWEQLNPALRRVKQRDWDNPACAEWASALDTAVADTPRPVLIAHSLGCLLAVHWASQGRHDIKAALLVAPPDPESDAFPPQARGFAPLPMTPLQFPSIVLSSSNDPYCSQRRASEFARAWGSEHRCIGAFGHINGASGLGHWPAGLDILQELTT